MSFWQTHITDDNSFPHAVHRASRTILREWLIWALIAGILAVGAGNRWRVWADRTVVGGAKC